MVYVLRLAYLLVVLAVPLGARAQGVGEVSESAPQYPSSKLAADIYKRMDRDPVKRDYPKVTNRLKELCKEYPGSGAAYDAIFAVKKWAQAGYVPDAVVEEFVEMEKEFNPAKDELANLQAQAQKANTKDAHDELRRIGKELLAIADEHPGTVSRFVAIANLGPLYHDIGDHARALTFVSMFLDEYPIETMDYPEVNHYTHVNIFLQAKLIAMTGSIDESIEAYQKIESRFSGRPVYGLVALYDAGMLSLKHERPSRSIELFNQLIADYGSTKDDRVTLANFRIGEAYLAMGDREKARAQAAEIIRQHSGTRWQREAQSFIDYIDGNHGPTSQDASVHENLQSSSGSRHVFLILLNIVFIVVILGILCYRLYRVKRQ